MLRIFLIFAFSFNVLSATIVALKGKAFSISDKGPIPLKLNDRLLVGSKISTQARSFVKIVFEDKTTLFLGAKSSMVIEKFETSTSKTHAVFNLIDGRVKAFMEGNKKKENNNFKIKSKTVSLAVRGTKFLFNSYAQNSQPLNDVVMLEGKVDVYKNGKVLTNLEKAEMFNTDAFSKGIKMPKLSQSTIDKLIANESLFMPELKLKNGMFKGVKASSMPKPSLPGAGLALGAGAVVGSATGLLPSLNGAETKGATVTPKNKKVGPQNSTPSHIVVSKIDPSLPSDIKDALIRRKELRKQNICFYWFYKTLPGSFSPERFRRERACDEFENDLD